MYTGRPRADRAGYSQSRGQRSRCDAEGRRTFHRNIESSRIPREMAHEKRYEQRLVGTGQGRRYRARHVTGSTEAFSISLFIVIIWVVTGPVFNYSDTWQLVINTGTTIITFLMVFLIQRSQNKDSLAVHIKLNELIASSATASNRLVDVEDLTEAELEILHRYYELLSQKAKKKSELKKTHSIDED